VPKTPKLRILTTACILMTMTTACQDVKEPAVPPADLVLRGGKIVTIDAEKPEAQALAARDGEIVAVGSDEEIAAYVGEATEVVDLAGRLAIPGFVEAHAHFVGLGDSKMQLELRSAESWEEIVAQVAEAAAAAEPGTWIRGRGWHQDKWVSDPEPAVEGFPVHSALSEVAPEHPVVLTHASGHAVMVNFKAMELAGIDESTPDPPGGELIRDAEGRPTGLLSETAEELVTVVYSPDGQLPAADVRRAIRLASEECLRKGVTAFHDAGSSFETIDLLRESAENGGLGVRLWVMVLGSEDDLAEKLADYRADDGLLSVGGVKLWIDGALGSRGAWLLEPYADSPDSTGLNLVPLDEAKRVAELALENDYQMAIHAIGDRANREVLDLYENVFEEHGVKEKDLRWRIEHAQHLHADDVPRFAELGIIPSVQTVHCTSDAPWVPERIGDERAQTGAYVWRDLLESGAKIANGTDAPVEDVDPIANFYAAVSRRMADGEVFYPEQRMTREEALRSMTLDAAYAAFDEGVMGSLEPGKVADVVVLSKDILTVPEEEILDAEVDLTIRGGEVAYRRE